jgi:glycosyltransferase involved in cell wall biosynthesis
MISISVVIPTHNPRSDLLQRVLTALRRQTLQLEAWELLVVDNASSSELACDLVTWHPQGRVLREPQLGLTHARLRGLNESNTELLVWVDDDNVLAPNYLENTLQVFQRCPALGAAGGASIPEFEEAPPVWYEPGLAPLGCRDLGDEEIWMRWDVDQPAYPSAAPIGAGLVIRRTAMQVWAEAVAQDTDRLSFGRRGAALSSGEDNDINLTMLREGWELAYLPQLRLKHIIPANRLTLNYQKRIARASYRDFIRVLNFHGIRPWTSIPRWSVPLRSIRTWLRYRAWSSPAQQVRWFGAIGQYEGRASLSR